MVPLACLIFLVSYGAIALEHKLKVNKSAIALVCAGALWITASISGIDNIEKRLSENGADVFGIIVFLQCAMSLIEILDHYEFFDYIRGVLFWLKLEEKWQFVLITFIAFFLSAILDNLTTTIVMITVGRKFCRGNNLLYLGAGIVIAANAGGAWSPIGDLPTIILWFSKKFTVIEIITRGFLPSLTIYLVSIAMMFKHIEPSSFDDEDEIVTKLERSEKTVIAMVLCSFLLPITMSLVNLPPYIGLVIGLGVVWTYIETLRWFVPKETHLNAQIDLLIKKIDLPSIKFFIGILLAVGALHNMGILDILAEHIYGSNPTTVVLIAGNVGLGLLSAILDNVPLTAIAIQMLHSNNSSIWVLLALTVGTGGSLLIIGSAAGVVAMGLLPQLNFVQYFKIAFIPALLGYIAGIVVWCVQYFIFGF